MDDRVHNEEVHNLKKELKEARSNLFIAATHGKTLLEENVSMKKQMASMQQKHISDIDGFTQEIHTLRSTIEMMQNEAANQIEDVESLTKKCQALEQVAKEEAAQEHHRIEEKASLEADMKVLEGRATQAELEKSILEKQISEMELDFARKTSKTQIDMDQKLVQLEEKNCQQLAKIAYFEQEIGQWEEEKDALTNKCAALETRISTLKEELEGKACEANCYSNALENCRQDISNLKAELSKEKMPASDLNKRGNSLFSEIEDRRQILEKQTARMREKYLAMKTEHKAQQAHVYTLNLRISSLERNMSHKVDASYAERLEEELATAHRDIDAMRSRVQFYDVRDIVQERHQEGPVIPASHGGSEYGFMSVLLAQEKQRVSELEGEKKSLYFKYAMARDEAQEHRRRFYHKEKTYGNIEAENVQLRAEKQALLDKCRASGNGELHESPLQTESRSNEPLPLLAASSLNDPTKYKSNAVVDKENATKTNPGAGLPASVVMKKNDCKQQ